MPPLGNSPRYRAPRIMKVQIPCDICGKLHYKSVHARKRGDKICHECKEAPLSVLTKYFFLATEAL